MATLLLLAFFTAIPSAEPTTANEKVVEFALANVGKQVGNGDCATLAREALRYASASRRSSFGDEVKSLDLVQPGDILQFVDVVIIQRKLRADGAVIKLTIKSPSHIAIVERVEKQGNQIRWVLLHQNSGFTHAKDSDKKLVQQWAFNLAEKKSGLIKAYHPVSKIEASRTADH